MTTKEPKETPEEGGRGRKSRGMGGVILILALLMALFLVVSKPPSDGQNSVHAFFSHLLNGRLRKFSLSDGVATAEYKVQGDEWRPIEVVVREFLRNEGTNEIDLYSTLASQTLDLTTYSNSKEPAGTQRFLEDLKEDNCRVLQAFLVEEVASKEQGKEGAPQRHKDDPRTEGTYLTALLLRGNKMEYVKVEPPTSSLAPSLLKVTDVLKSANVP